MKDGKIEEGYISWVAEGEENLTNPMGVHFDPDNYLKIKLKQQERLKDRYKNVDHLYPNGRGSQLENIYL